MHITGISEPPPPPFLSIFSYTGGGHSCKFAPMGGGYRVLPLRGHFTRKLKFPREIESGTHAETTWRSPVARPEVRKRRILQ